MKFDKAFVISLEDSVTRREQFFKYCQKAALSVRWFKAVDGRHINRQELRNKGKLVKTLPENRIQAGTLATMLSHVGVWESFLKTTGDVALVFEDDTIIPRTFCEEFTKIDLGTYSDMWDMIYLGGNKIQCTTKDGILGVPVHGSSGNTGQYGYAIHRRGIEKLKSIILPYKGVPHDIEMRNNFDSFNAIFLMNPIVSVHRFRFPSVRKDANHRIERKKLTFGKKVIRWVRG